MDRRLSPNWEHELLRSARRSVTLHGVNRRDVLKVGGAGLAGIAVGDFAAASVADAASYIAAAVQDSAKADITLRIAPVTVELAPDRVISTIGYNGTSPGPVLRMREGQPV